MISWDETDSKMEGSNKAGIGRDAAVTFNLLAGTTKAFPTLKEEMRIKAKERIVY
jgi:hypothetical protein